MRIFGYLFSFLFLIIGLSLFVMWISHPSYVMFFLAVGIAFMGMYLLKLVMETEDIEQKEIKEKEKLEIDNYRKYLQTLIVNCSKEIQYSSGEFIMIDESNSIILIHEKKYSFKDIIDFEILDNQITVYSSTKSKTSTNTASMLGRAAVGGVLTGGVGAVVGGLTAKKTTISEGGESSINHNYRIVITINSISNPIIYIENIVSNNEISEISSLLKVIINRNM